MFLVSPKPLDWKNSTCSENDLPSMLISILDPGTERSLVLVERFLDLGELILTGRSAYRDVFMAVMRSQVFIVLVA